MEIDLIKAALAVLQGQIYKEKNPNSKDLENLRLSLGAIMLFIETRQCHVQDQENMKVIG